jgi:DegV family protein with EDD domain
MSIRIITDSTADLTPDYQSKATVIPMTIRFGEEEYADGVEMSKEDFYKRLADSPEVPTTSQIPPQVFADVFRQVADDGDEAIVITVSQKLSGTYQSACIAAEDYDCITVVDSKNVAIGSGVLVSYAIDLLEQGDDLPTIVAKVMEAREKVRLVAVLDTLEYLKKGGRISKTVAFAGGLLSIKPLVGLENGEIKMIGKARGNKLANNMMNQQIAAAGGIDFSRPCTLGYTGLSDELLKKYLDDNKAMWKPFRKKLPVMQISCVIGTHAGPGAIAVAFFAK